MSLNVLLKTRYGGTTSVPLAQYARTALFEREALGGVFMGLLGAYYLSRLIPVGAPAPHDPTALCVGSALFLLLSIVYFSLTNPVSKTFHREVEIASGGFRLLRVAFGVAGALFFFGIGTLGNVVAAQTLTHFHALLLEMGVAGFGLGVASSYRF